MTGTGPVDGQPWQERLQQGMNSAGAEPTGAAVGMVSGGAKGGGRVAGTAGGGLE